MRYDDDNHIMRHNHYVTIIIMGTVGCPMTDFSLARFRPLKVSPCNGYRLSKIRRGVLPITCYIKRASGHDRGGGGGAPSRGETLRGQKPPWTNEP